jgi:hypothetical protein
LNSAADAIFGQKTFFGGIGALTRQQRSTRGLSAKRMKMADGRGKPASELHLNTKCCMEMGFDCVDGEPPAAAAKLRSGMDLVLSLLAIMTSILNIQHLVSQ